METEKYILEVAGVNAGYSKEDIIQDISFQLKKGDFLGIIGPNGSGKTTLLRTISGVLRPHKGKVFLKETDVYSLHPKTLAQKIAVVNQGLVPSFSYSVLELVLMGRSPHLGKFQSETGRDFDIVRQSLELTDTLKVVRRQFEELSAGEKQATVIAKALAQEPQLLILDEPTAHLDIGHQIKILDLIKKLNRENGLTVIMVMHDLNLASEYCQRLILLDKGRIYKIGKPKEVLTYQIIEEVYNCLVIVNPNPISGKPHILLVSEEGR
jgi:iron complex transport system ATP-binding protein